MQPTPTSQNIAAIRSEPAQMAWWGHRAKPREPEGTVGWNQVANYCQSGPSMNPDKHLGFDNMAQSRWCHPVLACLPGKPVQKLTATEKAQSQLRPVRESVSERKKKTVSATSRCQRQTLEGIASLCHRNRPELFERTTRCIHYLSLGVRSTARCCGGSGSCRMQALLEPCFDTAPSPCRGT